MFKFVVNVVKIKICCYVDMFKFDDYVDSLVYQNQNLMIMLT